jgi:2-polyprenyl-6-methoxyphenol hydroxylase-like FAD-dependent oxidoreductase
MASGPLRIAVAGSGVGGPTAAIARRAKGFRVEVVDQAAEADLVIGADGVRSAASGHLTATDEHNARLCSLPETVGWIHGFDVHAEL